jgi:hypothetical protein
MLNLIKLDGRDILKLELDMFHHSLQGFLGLVLIPGQEQQNFLLIKVVRIILNLFFGTVDMELFQLFLFILIMLYLSIKIKPSSLLIK